MIDVMEVFFNVTMVGGLVLSPKLRKQLVSEKSREYLDWLGKSDNSGKVVSLLTLPRQSW